MTHYPHRSRARRSSPVFRRQRLLSLEAMEERRLLTITPYFDDLAGFDSAAGSPPVAIDFDDISPGTDITGSTISGVTFDLGNLPVPSAPLIVVRGNDTFTMIT